MNRQWTGLVLLLAVFAAGVTCVGVVGAPIVGKPAEGGLTSPDGKAEVQTPLPESERKHNVGGRDGQGLCVFTSIEYASRWCGERRLFNFQQQMRSELGGGWPAKVDQMIKKYAPGVAYVQDTSADLELLQAALTAGHMVCVTYDGHDCHYGGTIGHMVCCVCAIGDNFAIFDNNFTKDSQTVWMTRAEFVQRWKGNGGGWLVILLRPGPPPVPHN